MSAARAISVTVGSDVSVNFSLTVGAISEKVEALTEESVRHIETPHSPEDANGARVSSTSIVMKRVSRMVNSMYSGLLVLIGNQMELLGVNSGLGFAI